ncbi:MAG: hypothetical protein IJ683_14600 [Butyrivibrio sp.]|nr:hypothetical protein [Butyrivibrio sp.]MBR1643538.1 hypothetical protein [Butyrivibrio sp.]
MSVQYYRNSKTGRTYAYESVAKWDPEKGYSVPERKYLGRVDPITNEIIPTTGKPGRRPGTGKSGKSKGSLEMDQKQMQELQDQIEKSRQTIEELRMQIQKLEKQRVQMQEKLKRVSTEISAMVDSLI